MPEEWIIAQSAQRYIGALRDPSSFEPLIANLKARPAQIDVTMDALWTGATAILGMSLRTIGVGAAQGLSEWGDPRAFHDAELARTQAEQLLKPEPGRDSCPKDEY